MSIVSCALILAAVAFWLPGFALAEDFDEAESPPIGETAEYPPDPIKEMLMSFFAEIQGRAGDVTVLVAAAMMCLAFWKKMYRAGIGMLVILVGVVLIRIMISVLFG